VQALVDAGFEIHTKSTRGIPALLLTMDVEVTRILLDAGAEDSDHRATSRACEDPARIELFRLLLQRFPDSEPEDVPYLSVAARCGNLEAVQALVAARPPEYVNVRDYDGSTALHHADAEIMRLLLELGADPRVEDRNGETPLMNTRTAACVRLLLEAAPDQASVKDSRGWNAVMHLSCSDRRYEALEELFRYCEEHGVDAEVNNKANNRATALHEAMSSGSLCAVTLLLEKGADALASGDEGTTTLMTPFIVRETHFMDDSSVANAERDKDTNACLEAVLGVVLLLGAEAVAVPVPVPVPAPICVIDNL
jgi:ankyrin repeat protein